ncbi:DUF3141 domain-containing protein [Chitinimonas sp. BJYL2]|uniref:DUF3141 domain-containing protein n=1 Tax=Chitinimonas sp. BJYL2 TaxID=2976696 RepID=UPI0022B359D9|nr:DUF3141 domain-containing protein [Chitinimonas sp. BJYL2]
MAHPFPTSFDANLGAAGEYWRDAMERSVLTLDLLRQRGNLYLEHSQAGQPPVLVFDYEMVVDGRTLERPANYALVRIVPPEGCRIDADKRPIVVIDPRAGHGPGIGGSKIDSEIGLALRNGHPCYFVMFFPEPVKGQTIECVARAEVAFLRKVRDLHPDSEGRPLVIGNCQGGWALMILASVAPELVGPLLLAGSPLSYWAGVEGKHPMRYNGGLNGGTWPASFLGDIGNGHFDGAWLVHNFEQLDPANTYWSKLYNLYAKSDTEGERFLTFERWWGGHFLLNREEIDWIVQNLFVGNKLTSGELVSADGEHQVDLRNIRSPIVVFASWGDNITPPQQALNWIPDLYADVEDIRAHGQVIVYCLHDKIGHLGIFVSASVANREHAQIVSAVDLIDMLPPGLYEAKIEDTRPDMPNLELIGDRYLIRFEPREVSDILALGDGRESERQFEVVNRLAKINQSLYDQFVSPWVRAGSNEITAHIGRALHPSRFERYSISDLNPLCWGLKSLTEQVKAQRAPVSTDNPFLQLEKQFSRLVEKQLDHYRDQRDQFYEQLFKHTYGSPWLATLLGVELNRPNPARQAQSLRKQLERLNIKEALRNFDHGSALDAFVRIMAYIAEEHAVDERAYKLLQQMVTDGQVETASLAEFRAAVQRQSVVLMLDEERALEGLPKLLPKMEDRHRLMDAVLRLFSAAGPIKPEDSSAQRYAQVRRILELDTAPKPPAKADAPIQPAPKVVAKAVASAPAKPAPAKRAPAAKKRAPASVNGAAKLAKPADTPSKPAAASKRKPATKG